MRRMFPRSASAASTAFIDTLPCLWIAKRFCRVPLVPTCNEALKACIEHPPVTGGAKVAQARCGWHPARWLLRKGGCRDCTIGARSPAHRATATKGAVRPHFETNLRNRKARMDDRPQVGCWRVACPALRHDAFEAVPLDLLAMNGQGGGQGICQFGGTERT
jgi:hypothetical protein